MRASTLILLSMLPAPSLLAQTTYTWTNALGGDLAVADNWTPNGVPSPTTGPDSGGVYGDEMLWDGKTNGDLQIIASTGQTGFSGSPWGLRLRMSSNQTAAVNIRSATLPQSAGTRMNSILIEPGAGAFSLGDQSPMVLDTLWGGTAPQTHTWINESSNAASIFPNVRWRYGAGGLHQFVIGGSGDWSIHNYLRSQGAVPQYTKVGSGTLFWKGTNVGSAMVSGPFIANPFTINGGTVVLQSSDLLGPGNTIVHNGESLVYDAPGGSMTLAEGISGTGSISVVNGRLILAGNNSFTGSTSVSNAMLVINGSSASTSVQVSAGATLAGDGRLSGVVTTSSGSRLAPGASNGVIGVLTIANDLVMGGDAEIELNRSAVLSHDSFLVDGLITNTAAGTIRIVNRGPALRPGDRFYLFNQAVRNGQALSIAGAGVTWSNDLELDGSIAVIHVSPPVLNITAEATQLLLSWDETVGVYKLQSQTNRSGIGLTSNWWDYPSDGAMPVSVPISAADEAVFFRLITP